MGSEIINSDKIAGEKRSTLFGVRNMGEWAWLGVQHTPKNWLVMLTARLRASSDLQGELWLFRVTPHPVTQHSNNSNTA